MLGVTSFPLIVIHYLRSEVNIDGYPKAGAFSAGVAQSFTNNRSKKQDNLSIGKSINPQTY